MKKGDVVTIYEDPVTQERIEGKARLLEPIDTDRGRHNGPEYWRIKFLEDDFVCDRFILPTQNKGN